MSVVENLFVQREPMPLVGVYFLQPTPDSIAQLVQDFSGARPLYPSVHVFFSSKVRRSRRGWQTHHSLRACSLPHVG